VFVLHAWSDCYPSFRDFMGDASIRKASIGAKTDDGFVTPLPLHHGRRVR
jgi:hypothetical protein